MHEPENVAVKGHPEIRVEFVVKSFSFIGKKNFRCETVIRAQAIVNFMCNLGIIPDDYVWKLFAFRYVHSIVGKV